jgi:hypothetical protein
MNKFALVFLTTSIPALLVAQIPIPNDPWYAVGENGVKQKNVL